MQFLVIEMLEGEVPDEVLQASDEAVRYFEDLKKKKKLVNHYHFAGIPGGALVLDVESNDELGKILISSPFYKYTRRTIYPLMSSETMVEEEMKKVKK